MLVLLTAFSALLISGCSGIPDTTGTPTPAAQIPTASVTPTATPVPTNTLQPSPTTTPTFEPINRVCSPLKGIELRDLHSITSQSFAPPASYKDDGHPAVDLAFFTFKGLPTVLGHPVQSILSGTVIMVLNDRFPYGNAILIETPIELLSAELLSAISLPTPIPQDNIDLVQPCASDPLFKEMPPILMSESNRSIYILYGHLLEKPEIEIGARVTCGDEIGKVGNSGNSAAEHLHLETRYGPSDAQFGVVSMYAPESTTEERYRYCIWTSSGKFQPFDPASLWQQQP